MGKGNNNTTSVHRSCVWHNLSCSASVDQLLIREARREYRILYPRTKNPRQGRGEEACPEAGLSTHTCRSATVLKKTRDVYEGGAAGIDRQLLVLY